MERHLQVLSSRAFQIVALIVLAFFLILLLYARTLWQEAQDLSGRSESQVALNVRGTEATDPLITTTYTTPNVTYTDPRKGASTPKVRIVGYEEYTCTHCRNMVEVMDQVLKAYPDTVQYVYKEFPPTDSIEDDAYQAANASRCADKQGKFWEYHAQVYANQFTLDDATYMRIAESLKLDADSFQSCLERQTYIPLIKENRNEGLGLQLTGTPYYFINDQEIPGSATFADFQTVIEKELKEISDAAGS